MRYFRKPRARFSGPGWGTAVLVCTAVLCIGGVGALRESRASVEPAVLTSRSDLDSLIARANRLGAELDAISDSMATLFAGISSMPLAIPAEGIMASRFAYRRLHPVLNRSAPHRGLDIAAPLGTPVHAPGAGVVSRVDRTPSFGLLLELDHGNGVTTRYAHLSRVNVKIGERVVLGAEIAAVGSSGLSTGPHLHYEVLFNGEPVDPLTFIH